MHHFPKFSVLFFTVLSVGNFLKCAKASRNACFACNTYMAGSGDPQCLMHDPQGVSECSSSSYGDCVSFRVVETSDSGNIKVDGEKGCVYPQHIKCFQEATGEKLPLGECYKVHISRYTYSVWNKCFQQTVIQSFENQHHQRLLSLDTNSQPRFRQMYSRRARQAISSTPEPNLSSTSTSDSPITTPTTVPTFEVSATISDEKGSEYPSEQQKTNVVDRQFEYCLCRGNFCNQKDLLPFTTEDADDEKASAVAIKPRCTMLLTNSYLLWLLLQML